MKRIFLFVLAVIFFATSVSAQVQFGMQVSGISSSAKVKEDGESYPGRKNLLGTRVGLIAKVDMSKQFSFMPELNFVLKGTKFEESETEEDMGYTYTYEMDARFNTTFA
ncbi:MAG: outer membrane beta-barrel protein [Chitinophagaceae bacterium]|nr:outer membrane beta-barrel protein [Chitinophagaceae bacterium]